MYRPKSFQPLTSHTSNGYVPKSFVPEKKTVSGLIGNVAKSGTNLVKDLGHSILHPVETGKALFNVGAGAVEKLIPGQQKHEQYADAVGQEYDRRYGFSDIVHGRFGDAKKKIFNTAYNDPIGMAMDISMVAGAGSGALKSVAGAASKGATAVDLASNTARIGRAGTKLGRFSEIVDPLRATSEVAGWATKPVRSVTSKVANKLNITPESVLTRGLGNPAKQRKMITPMGELIPKYNLYSRTPEAVDEALSKLGKQRTLAVESSGAYGKLQDLLKPLDDEIQALKSNPNLFRGETPLSPQADQMMRQLVENRNNIVRRFAETEDNLTNLNPRVSVADIDAFRREAIDPNIPEGSFAKQLSQTKAKDQAYRTTRNVLKKAVDKRAGTDVMGKDMQSLYHAKDVFGGYQNRIKNRQMFNFTKLGSAGVGAMVRGVPGAIGGFVVEQFVNSPLGLKIMYKGLKNIKANPFGRVTKSDVVTKFVQQLEKSGITGDRAVNTAEAMYKYAKAGRLVK